MQSLPSNPSKAILVHRRALIYFEMKDFKSCIVLIENHIAQKETVDSHLYYLLGKAYLEIQDSERAIRAFLKCRESFEGKVRDLIGRGAT